jgi:hypothetical protein
MEFGMSLCYEIIILDGILHKLHDRDPVDTGDPAMTMCRNAARWGK